MLNYLQKKNYCVSRPPHLRADSNDELKEVDIWYNVMYLNRDEAGNNLMDENKKYQINLLKRVGHISGWNAIVLQI